MGRRPADASIGTKRVEHETPLSMKGQSMKRPSDLLAADEYLFDDMAWFHADDPGAAISNATLFQTTELLFLVHLCTAEDTAIQLKKHGLGRIHHRLLYVAVKKPGSSVAEVLSFLRVTNQNIHKALTDLVQLELVEQRRAPTDQRRRELHATPKGNEVFEDLMRLQYERFDRVYRTCGKFAVRDFWRVLWCILDENDRQWLLQKKRLQTPGHPDPGA